MLLLKMHRKPTVRSGACSVQKVSLLAKLWFHSLSHEWKRFWRPSGAAAAAASLLLHSSLACDAACIWWRSAKNSKQRLLDFNVFDF
jgi:hypothetical protein